MLQNKLMLRAGLAASSVVVLGLTLSGCAQQGGYAAASTAADDVCRPQRLALDDSQQFFAGDIVKGALIGAAGGALTGLLLGGDGRSAALGAIAGATAGGFAGYWSSLQNQGGSRNDLISRMVGDMDREQQALDKAQVSFNALVDCRKANARQINADLREGKITREQATLQMNRVRQLSDQDIAIAKRINARVDERTANYVYATEQATGAPVTAAAPAPSPAPTASAPAAAPPRPAAQQASVTSGDNAAVRQSASTLVQKKQTFAQSTDTAQQSLSSELQITA
ncbi:MAG: hypothetical protein HY060_21820 [Proteobacteria bacterium]|nr:hypothetical protein [Pseudomonadota bacterium]